MRRFVLSLLVMLPLMFVGKTNAQTCDQGCLGTWCYVDVSLSDPVDSGYLVYTIPVPPEGFTGGIIGPGSPCFFNGLGNTIELHLRKSHLVVESDGNEMTTLILDAEVNKYVLGMEGAISSGDYVRCHYHIILRVTP